MDLGDRLAERHLAIDDRTVFVEVDVVQIPEAVERGALVGLCFSELVHPLGAVMPDGPGPESAAGEAVVPTQLKGLVCWDLDVCERAFPHASDRQVVPVVAHAPNTCVGALGCHQREARGSNGTSDVGASEEGVLLLRTYAVRLDVGDLADPDVGDDLGLASEVRDTFPFTDGGRRCRTVEGLHPEGVGCLRLQDEQRECFEGLPLFVQKGVLAGAPSVEGVGLGKDDLRE